MAQIWKAILDETGIEDCMTCATRQATRILKVTGNLKLTSKVLGHADIKTTTKYAHVTEDDVIDALDAAAALRAKPKKR